MDRERLNRWERAYRCFDRAWYYELLSSSLARRWERTGGIISFLVAVTSSGSAISAWGLWGSQWGRIVWEVIAGTASVLAIAQSQLRIAERVRKQHILHRRFGAIRRSVQGVLQDIADGQDLAKVDKDLKAQVRRYDAIAGSFDPDLAETRSLRNQVRSDTNNAMADEGFFVPGILKEENPANGTSVADPPAQ